MYQVILSINNNEEVAVLPAVFEELIFRARARLVRVFTGVKPQTSLAGRDFVPKSLLYFFSIEKKYTIFLVKISKVF